MATKRSKHAPRWVVKLGTGILTTPEGRLDLGQIERLVGQVVALKRKGHEVILVSSGAIGGGMGILGLTQRPKVIEELQACAAIGQPQLMRIYEEFLSRKNSMPRRSCSPTSTSTAGRSTPTRSGPSPTCSS